MVGGVFAVLTWDLKMLFIGGLFDLILKWCIEFQQPENEERTF